MEADQIHRVYFIGAGGIGMAALARYFLRLGRPVAGYDRTPGPLTLALQQEGAALHFREATEEIPVEFLDPAHTLVVYTPAVPATHKELAFFRERGFAVKKRAEVLGLISGAGRCLAVAGTHGKTTTSCILAHLLREAGYKITAFLGGVSEDFQSNFLMEGDDFTVVEADEFDRSFLWLHPEVACITSMDADHLDIYGTAEALAESFREFASGLKPGGTLLVRHGLPLDGLTYGTEEGASYGIQNLKVEAGCYHFDLAAPGQVFKGLRFCKPGRHNLLNGVAALAMALQVVPASQRLTDALATFRGVQRRFTYRVNTEDLVYIDDYAHHPAEIDAVHQAVREMHPGKDILAVFQPHLFSRTRDFGSAFAQSLSRFDEVWLLDIYPARELPLEGIDSHWLLEQIDNPRKKWVSGGKLIEELERARPGVLLTLGAGDIGLQAGPIENALCHENE